MSSDAYARQQKKSAFDLKIAANCKTPTAFDFF
jgi:hypothetical protein